MRILAAAAFAATIGQAGLVQAADQDVTLVNRTGAAFEQVYVSVAGAEAWDQNVLDDDDTLENGEPAAIAFDKETRGCLYDLKVITDSGNMLRWNKLDLCESKRIVIYWDRDTGATRAAAESE